MENFEYDEIAVEKQEEILKKFLIDFTEVYDIDISIAQYFYCTN